MVRRNNIPEGWRNVKPIGQPMPGTRFIAFKAPLKPVINCRLTPNQKFTPKGLLAALKALNVELGLIIDLTFTTRYYDDKNLPKSVAYKKIFTFGHGVPDEATILQFKKCVRKFLWENAENEKLIGVHCTNGINRTGYLICRYLIDVEGWTPLTAIRVFGEARGHHMDRKMYLLDLRTHPMRSNEGMDVWDDDGDQVPPPIDTDGNIDRFPSEEYPRAAKTSRFYSDDHNDGPEQIRLREFDFINKGPGQRRKPYYDQQSQDDPEPQVEMRQSRFGDHQFYDEYQEEIQLKDLDFAIKGSRQRLRSCHDHHLCDDFPGSTQPKNINMGHGQRQEHFPDIPPHSDMLIDSQFNRGPGQRRRPFDDSQPNNEYQSCMQLKKLAFHSKRPEQRMRPFQDCFPHGDIQTPVGEFEFVRRGRGQQTISFLDHQHHSDLPREMPVEAFDNRGSKPRCRPFCDSQSCDDFSEQVQLKGFLNRDTEQRMRPFGNRSPHDNVQYEAHVERPDCSEDYRRICSLGEIIKARTRFAPYSSHPVHLTSSSHQEVSSVAVDPERETREVDQGKRLPVITIDYNYGLPLNYKAEEEDRVHYDSHPREHYIWK